MIWIWWSAVRPGRAHVRGRRGNQEAAAAASGRGGAGASGRACAVRGGAVVRGSGSVVLGADCSAGCRALCTSTMQGVVQDLRLLKPVAA